MTLEKPLRADRKQDDFDRMRDYLIAARDTGLNRLPPEPRLSVELGVSRGRLRTLLKRMESEGLIWRHVGKGTFLGQRTSVETSQLVSERVSLEHVIQARLALEPQLAAYAAIHATPTDLKALDSCLESMHDEKSLLSWKEHDNNLHLTIARASHNALLLLMFETMKAEIAYHFESRIMDVFEAAKDVNPLVRTETEHVAVVEAIKRHDPDEAEQAMRNHILSVRSSVFGPR